MSEKDFFRFFFPISQTKPIQYFTLLLCILWARVRSRSRGLVSNAVVLNRLDFTPSCVPMVGNSLNLKQEIYLFDYSLPARFASFQLEHHPHHLVTQTLFLVRERKENKFNFRPWRSESGERKRKKEEPNTNEGRKKRKFLRHSQWISKKMGLGLKKTTHFFGHLSEVTGCTDYTVETP